jgi:NADH-quinone oxidoreductase subunit F
MERDPHRLMEGCIIAGFTLGLKAAYIYVRGELVLAAQRMEAAIAELYATGLLGKNIQGSGLDFDIYVHRGAGAYICGEETALIESREGKTGQPRLKPPFPAVVGVFGCPTVVNNVESIACVPLVIERGAEWWAAQGSEKNGGPKIVQISGKVKRPGTYEVPNGISLRDVVFSDLYGGGPLDGRTIRGVIPGGTSCPVLRADQLDVKHDFDALKEKPFETMAGTSGVIVMDDTVCVVRIAARIARFQGITARSRAIPQKPVAPAMNRPAPTKADRPQKPGWTSRPSTAPTRIRPPAVICTCRISSSGAFASVRVGRPEAFQASSPPSSTKASPGMRSARRTQFMPVRLPVRHMKTTSRPGRMSRWAASNNDRGVATLPAIRSRATSSASRMSTRSALPALIRAETSAGDRAVR